MKYVDEITRDSLLGESREKLRWDGRFILNMYQRAFFEQHRGTERSRVERCKLCEQRYVRGNRLYLSVEYRNRRGEHRSAWQLYLPSESDEQAARHALKCLRACAVFNKSEKPGTGHQHTQVILKKQA